MNYLGVPTEFDPNDGISAGAAFVPTDLDPNNQTRSDARRTYYDPYVSRANFHVNTGHHVTRVLFEGQAADSPTTAPATSGDLTGTGNSTSIGGNVFGANSRTSPAALPGSERLRVTQANTTNVNATHLRATGVEVKTVLFHGRSFELIILVCAECYCPAPDCLRN